MTVQAAPNAEQRELEFRRSLTEITNQINSADSIAQILTNMKDKIRLLVGGERLTIYAIDTKNQELYSLEMVGDMPKEIRVAKSFSSIAGFAALSRRSVNIKNAYDQAELKGLHPNLKFDQSWDQQSGFRTNAVLAVPIMFEKYLLGVLQVINKQPTGSFSPQDVKIAEELARILGIAFYNQHKAQRSNKPSKYGGLVDKGVISEKDIEQAANTARINNSDIAKVLMEDFAVPKDELGNSLASFYGTTFFDWDGESTIADDIIERVGADIWKKYTCCPLDRRNGALVIAVDDPHDLTRLDAIRAMSLSARYEFWVGTKADILGYVGKSYGVSLEDRQTVDGVDIEEIIDSLGMGEVEIEQEEEEDDVPEIDETDSGIVALANQVILEAYRKGASDIHIEPQGSKNPCRIRLRIDGACQEYLEVPGPHRNALIQRLKIMSGLDISERRKPQDGKIRMRSKRGMIELRVATIPTANQNEDVVMRILAGSKPLPLDSMGFHERNLAPFKEAISKPYGICLVVGPTGSGKTTTLHSALGYINTVDRKIWTAEDPVEITQAGLRQVQVHPKIGFTFAIAMRAFLRADPDVIMVGEMRDHETAAIGIEASLTGHLVFSTLHTNSAPETITRLLDMGIDPFNFADALIGILAQRLIRTLCGKCKEGYHPTQDEFADIEKMYGAQWFESTGFKYTPDLTLYKPKGCNACGDTGYKGRMGVHELLVASDELKNAIQTKATIDELRNLAMEQGMRTLLQDALEKALDGHTDIKMARSIAVK